MTSDTAEHGEHIVSYPKLIGVWAALLELEEIEGRPIHCGTKFPALAAAGRLR